MDQKEHAEGWLDCAHGVKLFWQGWFLSDISRGSVVVLSHGGTQWPTNGALCSDVTMPPGDFLGEIWGCRRADHFDQCCRPS